MIRAPHFQKANFTERRKRKASQLTVQRQYFKHAFFLIRFSMIFGLFLTGFCLYLLNSNYSLFEKSLLVYAPSVVASLTEELHISNVIVVGAFLAFSVSMAMLGIKVSQRIIVPVFLIQERMKALCHGRFYNSKLNIRKNDEFQEYCETFNYLADTLANQIELDIKRLEQIRPDPKNFDAIQVWEQMLNEKMLQIGKRHSDAAEPAKAPPVKEATASEESAVEATPIRIKRVS